MYLSTSRSLLLSIMLARFTILTLYPRWLSRTAIDMKPIGYISKTGVDGTRSLTGP